MSMKKRFVSLGLVAGLVTLIWFLAAFRPAQSRLGALNDDVDDTRQEVASLQAKLEQLQQLERSAPEVRARADRMAKALPKDQPRVQDVILQIQDAANAAGIDFLTITPSIPAVPPEAAAAATSATTPGSQDQNGSTATPVATPDAAADPVAKLRSIDMQIKAEGEFFEMENFVLRLEQLARAMRIDDLALTASDQAGGATKISGAMKVRIFMLAPQAAVAAPAPTTTQGTSGAN